MPFQPENLILIGYTQKPYGLVGELKVRPASFDQERHADLARVFFRKRAGAEIEELEVRGSRSDGEFWFLKFKGLLNPEQVAHLSGGQLLIPESERLELPAGMVYISDVPGMEVIDENGESVGAVIEVLEQGAGEMLVVGTSKRDILIPWNDHFVKGIDKETRKVRVDLSALRGLP